MNKCLIIVDVQCGFVNEYTAHIPPLVEVLQHSYESVIITRFINEDNSPFRKLIYWDKLSANSNEVELAFNPKPNSIIIDKNIYSCVNEQFLSLLNSKRISTVHVCGIETDICVTKIAVDLFENNIVPVVLKDYCASTAGEESHAWGLKTLSRYIGKNQIINGNIQKIKKAFIQGYL